MKKKKTELFWYRECYRTKRFFFSQFSEKERNGERERNTHPFVCITFMNYMSNRKKNNNQQTNDENKQMKH